MYNRRRFITNTACASCAGILASRPMHADNHSPAEVGVPEEDFPCSTVDVYGNDMSVINFSPEQRELLNNLEFTDYGTFVFSKRWLRSDGLTPGTGVITIGVSFLNGSTTQQNRVVNAARSWLDGDLGQLINLRFDVPSEESQVRVLLGGNRNNSYVGRDNLRIATSEPTMRLGNFNREATVKHEFGHMLGLRHEHRFPGAVEFDEEVVLREMRRRGWSTAQTYRNILTPLDDNAVCVGDPSPNHESIMMYTIPRRWTTDGSSFSRAGHITDRDRSCVVGVYSI